MERFIDADLEHSRTVQSFASAFHFSGLSERGNGRACGKPLLFLARRHTMLAMLLTVDSGP